ncbi:MAG: hypothetical protein AAGG68_21835 [Bacteroidota bacterium]
MKLSLFISLFIISSFSLYSQGAISEQYKDNSIYLQRSLFGHKYVKGGQIYKVGFMGNKLKKEMQVNPNAVVAFKKYRTNQVVAASIAVVGSALVIWRFSDQEYEDLSIFSSALITVGWAGILTELAYSRLQKSIWRYNQDLLR